MTWQSLWETWLHVNGWLNQLSLPVGLAGLIVIALYNVYKWQQDKVLLAHIQALPPRPALGDWPALPTVSVLVAAWNEADFIERHIKSFLSLSYPHKELVLIAGGADDTYLIAKRYASQHVKVLEQQPGEGKQRSLAKGFPHTQGEIIFLTDADCLLDDDAFERTVYLIAIGKEQVCTGGSIPLPEQLDNAFVFTQAATQVYSSLHQPAYADGLLGRNCAVTRELLKQSRALEAEALSGTDYVTAKKLVEFGARIKQLAESRMPTRFPTTVKHYLRQQRRWLRNVVVQGRRFGAQDEVHASLQTSVVGLVMLVLPLIGIAFCPWILMIWVLLMVQALFSRLRYLYVAGDVLDRSVRLADIAAQPLFLLIDFVAWILPLMEYLEPRKMWTW